MKNTKIAWTDHSFSPWWGCSKVSDGCKNCYAATFSKRTGHDIWGVDKPRRFFGDKHWVEPLKWNKEAREAGTRKRVFCASMADVFEAREDLAEPRTRLFNLIEVTRSLDWLILTKRPENIHDMLPSEWLPLPPKNVWLGATIENQGVLDKRAVALLSIPAYLHFFSVEPQIGKIDLKGYRPQWVIVGGESGPGCRLFDPDWARSLRDQCQEAGIPYFMKQLGGVRDHRAELEDLPEDLRIREFPNSTLEVPA